MLAPWLLLASLVPGIDGSASIDPALRDRFLAEAPARWEQLAARAEHLTVHGTIKSETNIGDRTEAWICRKDGESFVFERTEQGYPSAGLAAGRNGDYAFKLKRATSEDEWALNGYDSDAVSMGYPLTLARQVGLVGMLEFEWGLLSSVPMVDVIAHPSFELLAIEAIDHRGERAVRLDFDLDMPVKNEREEVRFGGGTVVLDPATWAVREFAIGGSPYEAIHVQIEHVGEGADRHVGQVRVELRSGAGAARVTTGVIDRFEPGPVPESEFTLAAFGLTAPAPVEQGGRGTLGWALLVGAVGVMFVVASRFMAPSSSDEAGVPEQS